MGLRLLGVRVRLIDTRLGQVCLPRLGRLAVLAASRIGVLKAVAFGYHENGFTCRRKSLKPSDALNLNRAAVRRVVEAHRARNARVFGSVLRGQDSEGSDLDILIDPTTETEHYWGSESD